MQEFEAFQQAVANLGTAKDKVKETAAALHAAVDAKVAEVGQQVAAETAKASQ